MLYNSHFRSFEKQKFPKVSTDSECIYGRSFRKCGLLLLPSALHAEFPYSSLHNSTVQ